MRVATLFSALCAASLAAAEALTADIYIQPIHQNTKPAQLASITYDTLAPDTASIFSYEAPDIPSDSSLVRIGVYDKKSSSWVSGTTVASVDNFSKGYSPQVLLSVNTKGEVYSTALKGVRIDAGQTRDFGPQVKVLVEGKGTLPQLNKPVVLSPEGKKVEPVEKTLLQKYWWVLAVVGFLALSSGGAAE